MTTKVQQAMQLYKSGQKNEAIALLLLEIKKDPAAFDCIRCLGQVYFKERHYQQARQVYEGIHKSMPWDIEALYVLGKIWQTTDSEKALSYFKKAKGLCQKGSKQEKLLSYDIAKLLLKLGKNEHSLSLVNDLLKKDKNHIGASNLKAQILVALDRRKEAIALYEELLLGHPEQPELLNNLGELLKLEPETQERAAFLYRKAIKINPNWIQAHKGYASCLLNQGNFQEAIDYYKNIYRKVPQDIEVLFGMAQVYARIGQHRVSLSFAEKILVLDKNHSLALTHIASSYISLGSSEAAIPYLEQSLLIEKEVTSLNMLAGIYNSKKEYEKALDFYKESLLISSDQIAPNYQILKCLAFLFQWDEISVYTDKLPLLIERHLAEERYNEELPLLDFNNYNIPIDLHYRMAKFTCDRISHKKTVVSRKDEHPTSHNEYSDIIRIAYISPDFRDHPVGRLISPLLECHNRRKYEIYAYALTVADNTDQYRVRIEAGCDVFRDLSQYDLEKAISQIRSDKIDIIIDLAGHTKGAAPDILRQGPAPICCQLLGYPGTMGSSWHDYLLADRWLVPTAVFEHYSEKIIHLSNAFVGPYVRPSSKLPERSDIGLPEDKFVFVAFNRMQKIELETFDAWMQILLRTPNSILLLSKLAEETQERIRSRAVLQGINADRIFFSGHHGYQQYIDCHSLYDLFLDTWHYSAGSTLIACLSAGLPALTVVDETNASRMGASIIAATGLEDMITPSMEAYIERAVSLYENPDQIQNMRDHLDNSKLYLYDYNHFARQLELAFDKIIERYDKHLEPAHIVVLE